MEIEVNACPPETTLLSLSKVMPTCPDRRDDGRELTMLRIACLLIDDRRELCLIRNISAGGALVRTYSELALGRTLALELRQGESVAGVVRWCDGNMVGIMFNHLLDVVQLLSDSSDWPRPRQPRVEIQALARVTVGETTQIVQLLDLSQGGLKMRAQAGLKCNSHVMVEITGLPKLEAKVRWIHRETCGLVFSEPLSLKVLVRWVREQQSRSPMKNQSEMAA